MNSLRLHRFPIHSQLKSYVQTVWVFESEIGIPSDDLRIIVPNGQVKLIIPFRNKVYSVIGEKKTDYHELTCWVIGQMERQSIIDSDPNISLIGIEFNAWGAYKFLPVVMKELVNETFPAIDIFGMSVRELQDRIGEAVTVESKVSLIQSYLVQQLQKLARKESFVEFSLRQIFTSNGKVRIDELCRQSGYSKRHIDRKFGELVGISPKQYARIVRFHRLYRLFNSTVPSNSLLLDELYEAFHDQSHFIKEFRNFTGVSPREHHKQGNMLGSMFLNT